MSEPEAADVSLSGETLKATAAKFTMAAAGFAGTIIFAWELGAAGLGAFYVLMSAAHIANRTTGGIADAIQKRASETEFPADEGFGLGILALVAWTGFCTVGVFLVEDWFVSYAGFENAPLAFGVIVFTVGAFIVVQALLSATGQIGQARWIDAVRSVLTLVGQVALVSLGLGAFGLAIGEAVATALLVAGLYLGVTTDVSLPSAETVRSIGVYAKYSVPNTYLGRIYSEIDILLIRLLATTAAAGYYGIALRVSIPGTYIAMVASAGLFSKVSNLRSKEETVVREVVDTVSFTGLFAVPMLIGGVLLDDQLIVTLFGAKNRAATPYLGGLLLFQLLRSQSMPLEKTINGLDRPGLTTRVMIWLLVLNVVLGVGLTVWFGTPLGVVAATIVAETFRYAMFTRYVSELLPGLSVFRRPLFEQFAAGLAMAVPVYLLRENLTFDAWYVLVTTVGVGAVVYFLALLAISPRFRTTLFAAIEAVYPARAVTK